MYGTLYLIPCPISDETAPWDVLPAANRAVMDSLDYFIVENTRSARRFLSKAGIARPIDTLEFRELNEHTVAGREVEELVKPLVEGRSAGVVSEAGVPGVADPGALVVEACHRHGIRVVPLVGPSSVILAVMASGLNGQSERQSQLFIEAPYRNVKLMEQLLQTLAPETRLTLAMDITAPGEYIRTLAVREWRSVRLPEMNRRPAIFIIG